MATNIPPHNLSELVDALCALINNPEATVSNLSPLSSVLMVKILYSCTFYHFVGPHFELFSSILFHLTVYLVYTRGCTYLYYSLLYSVFFVLFM